MVQCDSLHEELKMNRDNYFLNQDVLNTIGAGTLEDFQMVFQHILHIYTAEFQNSQNPYHTAFLTVNSELHLIKKAKKVFRSLFEKYAFIFTDAYPQLFFNSVDYPLFQIYKKGNGDNYEFINFDEFLVMVQKIAVNIIFRWMSNQNPSISKFFVLHRVNLRIEFVGRQYSAGDYPHIDQPLIQLPRPNSKGNSISKKASSGKSEHTHISNNKSSQTGQYTQTQQNALSRLLDEGAQKVDLAKVNRSAQKKRLYFTSIHNSYCLLCGNSIIPFVNFIPVSENDGVKFSGNYCYKCDSFFVSKGEDFISDLKSVNISKDVEFHSEFLLPEYIEKKNTAISLHSSVAIFMIKKKGTRDIRTITVVTARREQLLSKDIYHYTDLLSRKLLLSLRDQTSTFSYNNDIYTVLLKETITKNNSSLNFFNINKIVLRTGGGLYSGIRDIGTELVDILLYSPYTRCLEVAHATYDRINCVFFMDSKVFRRFINRYGNPGVTLAAFSGSKSRNQFYTMQEESLLHAYGYNVGVNSSLSQNERHEILGEVIDLGIMTAHSIISLLEHNIYLHSNPQYYIACSDWESDIEYVENYRINPSRFFISK